MNFVVSAAANVGGAGAQATVAFPTLSAVPNSSGGRVWPRELAPSAGHRTAPGAVGLQHLQGSARGQR